MDMNTFSRREKAARLSEKLLAIEEQRNQGQRGLSLRNCRGIRIKLKVYSKQMLSFLEGSFFMKMTFFKKGGLLLTIGPAII